MCWFDRVNSTHACHAGTAGPRKKESVFTPRGSSRTHKESFFICTRLEAPMEHEVAISHRRDVLGNSCSLVILSTSNQNHIPRPSHRRGALARRRCCLRQWHAETEGRTQKLLLHQPRTRVRIVSRQSIVVSCFASVYQPVFDVQTQQTTSEGLLENVAGFARIQTSARSASINLNSCESSYEVPRTTWTCQRRVAHPVVQTGWVAKQQDADIMWFHLLSDVPHQTTRMMKSSCC